MLERFFTGDSHLQLCKQAQDYAQERLSPPGVVWKPVPFSIGQAKTRARQHHWINLDARDSMRRAGFSTTGRPPERESS